MLTLAQIIQLLVENDLELANERRLTRQLELMNQRLHLKNCYIELLEAQIRVGSSTAPNLKLAA
jgi:hypothetical protein